jgi:hypothetical protein
MPAVEARSQVHGGLPESRDTPDGLIWDVRAAAMTMDLLSHPGAAARTIVRGRSKRKPSRSWGFGAEPPIGIEPMTYALQGGIALSSMVHAMASAPVPGP